MILIPDGDMAKTWTVQPKNMAILDQIQEALRQKEQQDCPWYLAAYLVETRHITTEEAESIWHSWDEFQREAVAENAKGYGKMRREGLRMIMEEMKRVRWPQQSLHTDMDDANQAWIQMSEEARDVVLSGALILLQDPQIHAVAATPEAINEAATAIDEAAAKHVAETPNVMIHPESRMATDLELATPGRSEMVVIQATEKNSLEFADLISEATVAIDEVREETILGVMMERLMSIPDVEFMICTGITDERGSCLVEISARPHGYLVMRPALVRLWTSRRGATFSDRSIAGYHNNLRTLLERFIELSGDFSVLAVNEREVPPLSARELEREAEVKRRREDSE